MFILFARGPDNTSTYAECFGADGGDGRRVAESETLGGLEQHVDDIGHDNFWVSGPRRTFVAGSRNDFYAAVDKQKEDIGQVLRDQSP